MYSRPSRPQVATSAVRAISRLLSNKSKNTHPENVVLADALNLLSPSVTTEQSRTTATTFKPSLFSNLTKGSANEQFNVDDLIKLPAKTTTNHITENYVNNLLLGIQSSSLVKKTSNYSSLDSMNNKDLSAYIKTIKEETRIFELMELFYSQNKLSLRILTDLILNKNVVHLDKSPVNLFNLRSNNNIRWEDINYTQFNIILLKKYHDLRKPLLIIKNLRENFSSQYLPLIEQNKLASFYERIVWKFNFEYVKQFNELHYIKELNQLKSSFLIWESSSENNCNIAKHILQNHKLNKIQTIFLSICANDLIQQTISHELLAGKSSKILSSLKKISIKYQLYNLSEFPNNESSRSLYYSLINSMENLILNELIDGEEQNVELLQNLKDIKQFREQYLMKLFRKNEWSELEQLRWVEEQMVLQSTKG
ncbi:predicted protein [Scheffersomyces stipitis CBS 6054]|uniref:Uncharacterized protein n=1 Tax=Scheffersomyces stipitis (strain ATCC 58785 / CBS 6054 / NBRC 10063 / NRRL Y-11545) TaxID=322104 RepID=A3LRY7_PICST|nr:predicted protein [Scheffersomyces stipitis CBS 6054]ABN65818.1 predicted protein [Scheffersomyces stipitis CBS 6054]